MNGVGEYRNQRIVVAITGATGVIYGIRLLQVLRECSIESHLIISDTAKNNILTETTYTIEAVEGLADKVYQETNLAASLSSGSFLTEGMVVIPCTIKTLSGIAHSYNNNLIVRAADVTLKERRKLVLVVRETPLHIGHLRLMLSVGETGATLLPPIPAFYHNPKGIEDLIDQTIGKILDLFHIEHSLFSRWQGHCHS
ncbi:MAG: UbiX family flavin prenyltransferase [Syntrophorhabdales bacterium]|jgi:4-hydroxy-3-polyprenylbenzoate decarboxylase